jgi:hypothetical protein
MMASMVSSPSIPASPTTTRRGSAARLVAQPLPACVGRFVELAAEAESGPFQTVTLDTTAWMHRPGLPPIPLEIRMAHRLGEAFVHDIRIGRRPVSVRFGLDAFVDGRGAMRIGRTVKLGPTYDRGALIAMWAEALTFPFAWLDRTDVRWEAIDVSTARLVVPFEDGDVPITVAFDTSTGLPDLCIADRHKGDGPLTPWTGVWRDWRVADGVLAPRRLVVRWLDEPDPWLAITVRSIAVGAPVDAEIARARRVVGIADQVAEPDHTRDERSITAERTSR